MPKLSYLKALNRALGDEMDRDPSVFVLRKPVVNVARSLIQDLRQQHSVGVS